MDGNDDSNYYRSAGDAAYWERFLTDTNEVVENTDSSATPRSRFSSYPTSLLSGSCDETLLADYINQKPAKNELISFKPTQRPNFGTSGKQILLATNHYKIICEKKLIYKYNVQFMPELVTSTMRRKAIKRLENLGKSQKSEFPCLVFDGYNTIFTAKRLEENFFREINIPNEDFLLRLRKDETIRFDIQFIEEFHLDTNLDGLLPIQKQNMIHALDTILRQYSCDEYSAVFQLFFSASLVSKGLCRRTHSLGWNSVNLGLGREVCYGFYQGVFESFNEITLNIDVATTTFYRPIALLDFLADVLEIPINAIKDGRVLSEAQKKKFSKEISGLKIETRHCNGIRRYRASRCTWRPAANIILNLNANSRNELKELPITEYYMNTYGIQLKYLHLPCIEIGRTRECIIPIELCYVVTGQRCQKKLNESQTASLIKATSKNAQERKEAIRSIREKSGIAKDEFTKEFGIMVDDSMKTMEGRVLSPPKIIYNSPISRGRKCVAIPNNGAWDMRSKYFYRGIEIKCWAVVCFTNPTTINEQCLKNFIECLTSVACDVGMPIRAKPCFCKYGTNDHLVDILRYIKNTISNIQLVVCVLPGKSNLYGELKRQGDIIGLYTQCVRASNVVKASSHTLSNICMKINSKLGGVNSIVSNSLNKFYNEPVLYVGCHVYRHTTSSTEGSSMQECSICCVIGSTDGFPTRFVPTFRLQNKSHVVIKDMMEMMKKTILNFHKSTGFKPHRIVVYRAGLTKTTTDEILQYELRAIRNACVSIESGYEPGITFVGVDNNHHSRLFAVYNADRIGVSMNVPAGTIVDTGITVNNLFEFLLVSHAGIQGTSCPTRYIILWDDNELTADEIHHITYQLCHSQSRCTRSVSVPAPVYYARSAAQRAKIWMADNKFEHELYEKISEQCNGMIFT